MSDILERLYRRAADMGKYNADQQVILQAADEIRRLRANLSALRTKDIARLVVATDVAPGIIEKMTGVTTSKQP